MAPSWLGDPLLNILSTSLALPQVRATTSIHTPPSEMESTTTTISTPTYFCDPLFCKSHTPSSELNYNLSLPNSSPPASSLYDKKEVCKHMVSSIQNEKSKSNQTRMMGNSKSTQPQNSSIMSTSFHQPLLRRSAQIQKQNINRDLTLEASTAGIHRSEMPTNMSLQRPSVCSPIGSPEFKSMSSQGGWSHKMSDDINMTGVFKFEMSSPLGIMSNGKDSEKSLVEWEKLEREWQKLQRCDGSRSSGEEAASTDGPKTPDSPDDQLLKDLIARMGLVGLERDPAGIQAQPETKENAATQSSTESPQRTPRMLQNELETRREVYADLCQLLKSSTQPISKLEHVYDQRHEEKEQHQKGEVRQRKRLFTSPEIARITRSNSLTLPKLQSTEHKILKEEYENKNVPVKPCICKFGKWEHDPRCEWPFHRPSGLFHKPRESVDGLWWHVNRKKVTGTDSKRQRSNSESVAERKGSRRQRSKSASVSGRKDKKRRRSTSESVPESPRTVKKRCDAYQWNTKL